MKQVSLYCLPHPMTLANGPLPIPTKSLFSGEDKTHEHKKDFKQQDITSAIKWTFSSIQLETVNHTAMKLSWQELGPDSFMTLPVPCKGLAYGRSTDSILCGGTQTRRNFLSHLILSNPEDLEIPEVLSYKDLSCVVSFTLS